MKKVGNIFKVVLLLLSMTIMVTACTASRQGEIEADTWEGNTYHSEYFGLKFDLPNGWDVGNKENIKAALDSMKNEEIVYLANAKRKTGILVLVAQKLPFYSRFLSQEKVVEAVKKWVDKGMLNKVIGSKFEIEDEESFTNSQGTTFYPIKVKVTEDQKVFRLSCYLTSHKGYLFMFVSISVTNVSENSVKHAIDTVVFE